MRLLVKETTRPLRGAVLVPNSKYHAHRALILASLAPGTSHIIGLSDARHVQYTAQALRALGTSIETEGDTFLVTGGPYRPTRHTISVGSSGTTLYFLTGLMSLSGAPVTLTAQKYFQRRPVGPLLDALRQMGLSIECAERGCPPISIAAHRPRGGHVTIPGTLSQWISGLLLAAPFARERTFVDVEGPLNERPYVQLTVDMMARFGLHVAVSDDWRHFEIEPHQEPQPATVMLPPDIGSAAFGLAAVALHPSDVLFRGLGDSQDHPEARFMDIIREMGLPLEIDAQAQTVRIRHEGIRLRGAHIDCREIPDMLPILCTLGTFAQGETILENVAHVRLKESDRIEAMLQLNRMGADLRVQGDRLIVRGVDRLAGAQVSSFNDHRVLMSLAVAATRAQGETSLTYPHAYRISYPMFLDAMQTIGIPMTVDALPGGPRKPKRTGAAPHVPAPARAATLVIPDLLRRWSGERAGETAVVDVREELTTAWSWHELAEQVDRTATLLLKLGVRPGESVAFQLPNWSEFVVISLATLRIGAVCCPLMPIFREREMAFMLERAGARVVFVPDAFRGRSYTSSMAEIAPALLKLEHVVVVPAGSHAHLPDVPGGSVRWHRYHETLRALTVDATALEVRRPKVDALVQLLFTSGTSGEPKGVLHRNDVLMRAAAMEAAHFGLTGADCIFVPSPLAHQTGFLYGMWLAILLGVPQIVQDVWNPGLALRALRKWGGTFVQAATPFLADLVKEVDAGSAPPHALRIFVATGAAVPRVLAQHATRVLGTAVCGAWGTTETCLGTAAHPGDPPEKVWGTDGRALAGVKIRVVDDHGAALPPGREGNFEIRTRCTFAGYLDHPDWTSAAFTEDGWYRTGDLAVVDESGYVRITGRVKDVINRGGEKIPVAEIEQLLYGHPAIAEVAIVAMPDERLGERACAFVVLRTNAIFTFSGMQRYLDDLRVAKQFWPERLELVNELPKTASGKIQKYLLRERAKSLRPQTQQEHAREVR